MPMHPDPRRFDAARRLGAIADFLVIPANAPHLFRDEIVAAERRSTLDTAIFRVQEGRDDESSVAAAEAALAELRAREPEAIVVGCTEIPLLLGATAAAPDLINPSQLLAEAAVREALR